MSGRGLDARGTDGTGARVGRCAAEGARAARGEDSSPCWCGSGGSGTPITAGVDAAAAVRGKGGGGGGGGATSLMTRGSEFDGVGRGPLSVAACGRGSGMVRRAKPTRDAGNRCACWTPRRDASPSSARAAEPSTLGWAGAGAASSCRLAVGGTSLIAAGAPRPTGATPPSGAWPCAAADPPRAPTRARSTSSPAPEPSRFAATVAPAPARSEAQRRRTALASRSPRPPLAQRQLDALGTPCMRLHRRRLSTGSCAPGPSVQRRSSARASAPRGSRSAALTSPPRLAAARGRCVSEGREGSSSTGSSRRILRQFVSDTCDAMPMGRCKVARRIIHPSGGGHPFRGGVVAGTHEHVGGQ